MNDNTDTKTILLTSGPVSITTELWPILACATSDSDTGSDPALRQQALRQGELDVHFICVRQHADGRTLVYATLDGATARTGTDDAYAGELLVIGATLNRLVSTIREAVAACGIPDRLAAECIAELPPLEID